MPHFVIDFAFAHRRGNSLPQQLAIAEAEAMDRHLDRTFALV